MTNHWIDIKNSDCILIMGSNAAENHPVSFKYVTEAMEKGATLISVDPRFTRTSSKADIYTALRSGTDIAFLGGMIKYILDNKRYSEEYVSLYTNAVSSSAKNTDSRRPFFRLREESQGPLHGQIRQEPVGLRDGQERCAQNGPVAEAQTQCVSTAEKAFQPV
jgi:formate dehydrogenase major subunit